MCSISISPALLIPLLIPSSQLRLLTLAAGCCLYCWVTCSPLILVSRPRAEVRFCPFLYYISLKKLFSPVQIAPALDITVLPQGTISGCSLEAMPRSLLELVNLRSALLLFSQRISYGSNTLSLPWTDPSFTHQQM